MTDFQYGLTCFLYGMAFGAWVINAVSHFYHRRRERADREESGQ